MTYFLVKCKFGHVGRNTYFPLNIPVRADSMEQASMIARAFCGDRKEYKHWCLEKPIEISCDRYKQEMKKFEDSIYFEKKNKSRVSQFKSQLREKSYYKRINGMKNNKKQYKRARDTESVTFKIKKMNTIIESLIEEYKY